MVCVGAHCQAALLLMSCVGLGTNYIVISVSMLQALFFFFLINNLPCLISVLPVFVFSFKDLEYCFLSAIVVVMNILMWLGLYLGDRFFFFFSCVVPNPSLDLHPPKLKIRATVQLLLL